MANPAAALSVCLQVISKMGGATRRAPSAAGLEEMIELKLSGLLNPFFWKAVTAWKGHQRHFSSAAAVLARIPHAPCPSIVPDQEVVLRCIAGDVHERERVAERSAMRALERFQQLEQSKVQGMRVMARVWTVREATMLAKASNYESFPTATPPTLRSLSSRSPTDSVHPSRSGAYIVHTSRIGSIHSTKRYGALVIGQYLTPY